MRKALRESTGLKELPQGLPEDQNSLPDDCAMFRAGDPASEAFRVGDGKKFFEWYTATLVDYGMAMLLEAVRHREINSRSLRRSLDCIGIVCTLRGPRKR